MGRPATEFEPRAGHNFHQSAICMINVHPDLGNAMRPGQLDHRMDAQLDQHRRADQPQARTDRGPAQLVHRAHQEGRKDRALQHAVAVQLGHDAGQAPGEAPTTFDARDLLDEVRGRVPQAEQARVRVTVEDAAATLTMPRGADEVVLAGLVDNALRASPDGAPIDLIAGAADGRTQLVVIDRGVGMDAATQARAVEPYFTTRAEGEGHGLGMFLAHAFTTQLGGEMTVESTLGEGTRVLIELPQERP